MGIIDFKEIKNDLESWELFAQEFLSEKFELIDPPSIGPDGGKDLIVKDKVSDFLWLVSCKHFAHRNSSNSVNRSDETDITDRVKAKKCNGFLSFYSASISSPLLTKLNELVDSKSIDEFDLFNSARIERELINSSAGRILFQRHFPKSWEKYCILIRNTTLSNFIPKKDPQFLYCENCSKELVEHSEDAKIIFIQNKTSNVVEEIAISCNECEEEHLKFLNYGQADYNYYFYEVNDLKMPTYYHLQMNNFMKDIWSGNRKYTNHTFDKFNFVMLAMGQLVYRKTTEDELQRTFDLLKEFNKIE
ncbi:hypothetical protein [Falsibacillus albus]|uniref:Restriction endonuclease n=1 Tax=Falsibacillus albus TaxID=2478915 RepID=A0A3L7JS00_9BACI|nr:hypothetical protein [Falsibacillus albus]RLQ93628.1 hypothetical protein D9X91_16725 [Falsibacillus albus]